MTADPESEIRTVRTPRYGMVVDINRCVGCQTCTIACKHANDTPPGVQWRRVLDVERGAFPDVERLFLVVGCQHCAEPPCVPVCPTGATRQRADGLVMMDYETCIGCGYCAVACPYQARTIVHDRKWFYDQPTAQEEAVHHEERMGVANKCSFCVERIDDAEARGLTPGVDLEVTPACSASCIAQAIHFGDFADPDSNVARLARDNAFFRMHEELGTDPQIKYLYEVRGATPGRDPAPDDSSDDVMSDAANALVGPRQRFWDLRAAMNFTLGGTSTGLVVAAFAAFVLGHVLYAERASAIPPMRTDALLVLFVAGGVGMAVGLFSVFLEIGRKQRFLYVLLRPRTSWMTRETYAVAVFYPALLADLLWPGFALHSLVACAAAAFLYCQARILWAGKGIPAWRAPLVPWLLVASGLYEGCGALLFLSVFVDASVHVFGLAIFTFVGLSVVNAALWQVYRSTARSMGIGPLSRRELNAITPYLHLVGHALPAGALVAVFFMDDDVSTVWTLGLAGLAAMAGGALWKIVLITRACHQQGFEVPRMPQRGSGARAAPDRLQPI